MPSTTEPTLLTQFKGDFTPFQAAQKFAGMATPEPRQARFPEGAWGDDRDYLGTFKLVGGKRDYRLTFNLAERIWRVYLVPRGWKAGKP